MIFLGFLLLREFFAGYVKFTKKMSRRVPRTALQRET